MIDMGMTSVTFTDHMDKQSEMLFRNNNHSGHTFMSTSTKGVTVKGEHARFLRDKTQLGNFPRGDVGTDPQARAVESMQPVQRGEFQNDRSSLSDGNRAGVVFVSFCGDLYDLLRLIGYGAPFRQKSTQN